MTPKTLLDAANRARPLPRWKRVWSLLLFALPFAAALSMSWWGLRRLRPILNEAAELTVRVSRISSQIDDMEQLHNRLQEDRVPERFQESLASYIDGEDALRAWVADVRNQAVPLALTLKTELGEPVLRVIAGESLSIIPVRIEVRPNDDVTSPRSTYQRLIEFCHFVAAHPRRADLGELQVSGGSGTVSEAVLTLNLWARAPRS